MLTLRRTLCIATAGVFVAGFSPAAAAQSVVNWSNPAGGVFSDPANWSAGVAPSPLDTAVFPIAGAYTVTFTANAATGQLFMRSGDVAFDLGGHLYDLFVQNTPATMIVGDSVGQSADLTITNGLVQALFGAIANAPAAAGSVTLIGAGATLSIGNITVGASGQNAQGSISVTQGAALSTGIATLGSTTGAAGQVSVTGAGSSWDNQFDLTVGGFGHGEISITGGGQFTSGPVAIGQHGSVGSTPASSGAVLVTGAGSHWSTGNGLASIGLSGDGSLTIADGASVFFAGADIGLFTGSTGAVSVSGAGSTWSNAVNLAVGNGGQATLDITAGAVVTNSTGFIASSGSSSAVTVSGKGSRWSNFNSLFIGPTNASTGDATLTISDGGAVTNAGSAALAFGAASTVTATVTGPGSTWSASGQFFLASKGQASLTIADGGVVTMQGGVVGNSSGSTGEAHVTGAGSQWSAVGDLSVGPAGAGSIIVSAGGVVSASTITVGAGGQLSGDSLFSASVTNGGLIAPGLDVGELTIDGGCVQTAAGELTVQLAGAGADQHDLLTVTGAVQLAGQLTVALANGFTPAPGDSFIILTGSPVSGVFDSVDLPPLAKGLSMQVVINPAFVTLSVTIAADLNGDGVVDGADLAALLTQWGACPQQGACSADLNNDGVVNGADLATLLTNWGPV